MLPLYAILIFDFGIIPTVWYFVFQILQLFRHCGIFFSRFCNYSDSVVFFFSRFCNYSDSVVFFSLDFTIIPTMWYYFLQILQLFRQCGIFSLNFGFIPTVWYFFLQILELFRQCGIFFSRFWNFSDRVVFLFFTLLLPIKHRYQI